MIRGRPILVAALVLLIYAAWIGMVLASGHDPRDFARPAAARLVHHHQSSVIKPDPAYRPNSQAQRRRPERSWLRAWLKRMIGWWNSISQRVT